MDRRTRIDRGRCENWDALSSRIRAVLARLKREFCYGLRCSNIPSDFARRQRNAQPFASVKSAQKLGDTIQTTNI